ncbi:DUF1488 domain-containing protein [Pantoea sp. At-9b]|uniref:DUF1488 domain-containing protein n=1 Tax=Pantoea sp. (strain At-9b) TaxID=592316 RepID=UPI0001B3F27F|nr:DUF1488 domain-containing protein [Pantoea sp. At-9b]ADU70892.1 protein of unknown function DUF1488 [Pantoea sp. At-9b]
MNQAIQFPDREEWDQNRQAVCFPAQVNGMGLMCAISSDALHDRFGAGEAMALFSANRWDLEDEAEQLILNDEVDNQGWVWLS